MYDGFKGTYADETGTKGKADWLFCDIPEKLSDKTFDRGKHQWKHNCTDPKAWLGTIYNGWNISHEYEDIEDIPSDVKIEDEWYPSFVDTDCRAGDEAHNEYYSNMRRGAAVSYGKVKVNGRWVLSGWEKNDNAYKYFYHHQYKGPKKPRPQHLWPHNIKP
jgi:hypothetical protein